MILKPLLLSLLTFIFILSTITAVNPALGFAFAIEIGTILAFPITTALKLGLYLRGLI